MISFTCACGANVKVDERFAGKLGRCPKCGKTVRIPGGARTSPGEGEAPPLRQAGPPPGAAAPKGPPGAPARAATSPPAAKDLEALASAAEAAHPPGRSYNQQPAVPRPRSRLDRNMLGIFAGGLMLVTLLIPWMLVERASFPIGPRVFPSESKVIMSWDILGNAPGVVLAFLIGSWIIGLGAVVLGLCLRGLPLSISNAGLGLAGLLLVLIVVVSVLSEVPVPAARFTGSGRAVLAIIYVTFLSGLIISTHLGLRLGASLPIRALQGVFAGVLGILTIVGFAISISDFIKVPEFVRDKLVFDLIFGIVTQSALLAAAVLALVHAANLKIRTQALARNSLYLIYGVFGAICLYGLIRPAVAVESVGPTLLCLNLIFLIGSILFLFCAGIINVVCDSAKAVRSGRAGLQVLASPAPQRVSAPAAGPSGAQTAQASVAGRLKDLKELREQGLVSEEDFAVQRARILKDL